MLTLKKYLLCKNFLAWLYSIWWSRIYIMWDIPIQAWILLNFDKHTQHHSQCIEHFYHPQNSLKPSLVSSHAQIATSNLIPSRKLSLACSWVSYKWNCTLGTLFFLASSIQDSILIFIHFVCFSSLYF